MARRDGTVPDRTVPDRTVPDRTVMAIDGPSGSGKTELALATAVELRRRGQGVLVVHVDDLYPGWDGLDVGVQRLLDGVLLPFVRGEPELHLARWDWARGRDGEVVVVPVPDPTPVLLVDGVGAGSRACAEFVSLLVWVEAPDGVRKARALARDGQGFAAHWDDWAAAEHAHFGRERTRERADLWVVVP
jgi:uridine kinase